MSAFDDVEAAVDHGSHWRFREPDAPNPLTIQATGWRSGVTKFGPAEFLDGVDRNGQRWSVIAGGVVLKKKLIDGVVEEWDDDLKKFVIVETLGRVKTGEMVSLKYVGDVDGAQYPYPNFRVARRPAPANASGNGGDPGVTEPPTPEEEFGF